MMIVISTQYLENYGDAENPYWKYKGGSEYKIPNFVGRDDEAESIVQRVRSTIEYAHEYAEEYVIGWSIVPDDYMTQFERDQILFEGKVTHPAKIINL